MLDGQIALYNKKLSRKPFLSSELIKDFDELNELFFEVLAIPVESRSTSVNEKFGSVPYLNSSLFEETPIESQTVVISDLKDRLTLSIYKGSILKDSKGIRRTGRENTLKYLLEFLDSYDFASDVSAEIQEQNKTLINASVLGLIFEKINGYRDGSIFTPGFVTSFMARYVVRETVISIFNEKYGWNCKDFTELYNRVDKISIVEANQVIDDLKICDPAVGSGHMLVSALNEIISIKSDLEILADSEGKRLRGYLASVENDELIITYDDELFVYNFNDPVSRRIQETIFLEKQKIIENCLFGVDINPKSVMICRLRLWIELLKHTYYTKESNYTQLETLPNIDINIKKGNSLVSRFNITDDYSNLAPAKHQKIKLAIQNYKDQVTLYKSTNDKLTKHKAQKEIANLKERFSKIVDPSDQDYKKLKAKEMELAEIPMLFTREEKDAWQNRINNLSTELNELGEKYSEKLKNIYRNAFEWRFEFPEVLDDDGNYKGFDIIIGNPPYIQIQKMTRDSTLALKEQGFETYEQTGDIYTLFYELGIRILKNRGLLCFISGNSWLRAAFGKKLQKFVFEHNPVLMLNLGPDIFDSVTIDTGIMVLQNTNNLDQLIGADLSSIKEKKAIEPLFEALKTKIDFKVDAPVFIGTNIEIMLNEKIHNASVPLRDWNVKIYFGLKTGLNEAFIIDEETRELLCKNDPKSMDVMRPILRGRDLIKYYSKISGNWLISTGYDLDIEAENKAVFEYLSKFKEKAEKRDDQGKNWYNLRSCAYYDEFAKPKVVWKRIGSNLKFSYDTSGSLCLDSTCIMTGDHLKYLCAYMNSKVAYMLLNDRAPKTGVGDMILSVQALEPLHVPPVNESNISTITQIEALVDEIIQKLTDNKDSDISTEENKINDLVYSLFNLTQEEIEIVERKNKV